MLFPFFVLLFFPYKISSTFLIRTILGFYNKILISFNFLKGNGLNNLKKSGEHVKIKYWGVKLNF